MNPARKRVSAEDAGGGRGAEPCPVAQRFGRHAAAITMIRVPAQALDPAHIRRALVRDENVYPIVKRCPGDWLTGYYAELQGVK
jgi:hypothetical protein